MVIWIQVQTASLYRPKGDDHENAQEPYTIESRRLLRAADIGIDDRAGKRR